MNSHLEQLIEALSALVEALDGWGETTAASILNDVSDSAYDALPDEAASAVDELQESLGQIVLVDNEIDDVAANQLAIAGYTLDRNESEDVTVAEFDFVLRTTMGKIYFN